jgi:pimeloyl-ACP methyl ester carboxylesterase
MTQGSTLLLVHGAWCGGWVWEPLLAELDERDVRAEVIEQLPSAGPDAAALGGLDADVEHVRARLSELGGPVVVCGHSYAGIVMTQLADHPAIARSVYLAAFWPGEGQSLFELVGGQPPPWIVGRDDDSLAITADAEHARDALFADLGAEDAARAHGRLVLQSAASFLATSSPPARSHPCTYVLCSEDRAVPPALQEMMSAPADDVVRLQCAHFAQLSQPAQLADLLAALVAEPAGTAAD